MKWILKIFSFLAIFDQLIYADTYSHNVFSAVQTDTLQGILRMFWLVNKYKSLPIKGKN